MFTIIGADGKEYGPVPAETLNQWIAAGRADAHTKARRAGETEWVLLGTMPEFAAATVAAPETAPRPDAMPLPAADTDPAALAADLIARAAPLDIMACVSRSWALLKANFGPLVGVTVLVWFCAGVAGAIPFLGIVVSLLLTGVFYGGLYLYYLKHIRGEPAEISDAFSGFSVALVPLMLASLVSTLLTLLGLLALILPGIYLLVAWIFTYPLVIDKRLPFWTGMETSRRVITAQWWRVFGLMVVLLVICMGIAVPAIMFAALSAATGGHFSVPALIGVALIMLGLAALLAPLAVGAIAYAYEDLCNPPPS